MGDNRLEIRTYRSLDELQTIVAGWNELLANYPLATTFSTPEWLISWWRSFGKDQKLLVAGFFAESRLVALAPFSLTRIRIAKTISLRHLRLMGDGSNDSDNLDLPVRPGFEDRFASSLLHFLQSERNSWDLGQLNTLPPQLAGGERFAAIARTEEVAGNREAAAGLGHLAPSYMGRLPGATGERGPEKSRPIYAATGETICGANLPLQR